MTPPQDYLKEKWRTAVAPRKQLDITKKQHDEDIEILRRNHEHEIHLVETRIRHDKDAEIKSNTQSYQGKMAKMRRDIEQLKEKHELELITLVTKNDDEIASTRNHYEQLLARADRDARQLEHDLQAQHISYEQAQQQLLSNHNNAMELLRTQSATELAAQANRFNEKLTASQQDVQDTERRADANMQAMTRQHAEQLSKQTMGYEEAMSLLKRSQLQEEENLRKQHERDTARLRQQVQQLGEALVERDDKIYQGDLFIVSQSQKTDRQLEDSFMKLQKLVDVVSGLDWRKEIPSWPDSALRAANDRYGKRSLRKALLQDLIWTFLFRFVFASPFRVFGAEGQLLEAEWFEKCGEDAPLVDTTTEYNWPLPTVQAERWRYMTVKECEGALRPPVPSEFDPRARLRRGFTETVKRLAQELEAELGQFLEHKAETRGYLIQLSKKATEVWLDFGRHRFRIVIRMPGSSNTTLREKLRQVDNGSQVSLTVSPVVGRYGSAKGGDLENFTKIGDLKGESLQIP